MGRRKTELQIDLIKEKITQRRRQILVHSFIYYRLSTSIISDKQFDTWGYELVDLQKKYPEIACEVIYSKEFENFDATTGFDLPYSKWIEIAAIRLLNNHREMVKNETSS